MGFRVSSHHDSAEVAPNPAARLGKGGEAEEVGGYRLQSQDSLGITRARLARQRENARMALLNQINSMQARAVAQTNPCVRAWQRAGVEAAYVLVMLTAPTSLLREVQPWAPLMLVG